MERARIADPGRPWQMEIDEDLVLFGDEELLRRAVDNLLANIGRTRPRARPPW